MTSFTEPLDYASTEIFRGGHVRPLRRDGQDYVELAGGRRLFRLTRGFVYNCGRTQRTYEVPAEFRCDLGSIPGIVRGFLSPDDPWAQAYVLHDFLYRSGLVDRKTADLILWDALDLPFQAWTEEGRKLRVLCPPAYRTAIYYAVRVGGGRSYLSGPSPSA